MFMTKKSKIRQWTDEELKTISFDTSIQKAEQLKNKHNNTKSLRGHSYYDST